MLKAFGGIFQPYLRSGHHVKKETLAIGDLGTTPLSGKLGREPYEAATTLTTQHVLATGMASVPHDPSHVLMDPKDIRIHFHQTLTQAWFGGPV